MCGIAGYLLRDRQAIAGQRIESLLGPIRGRGPDDEGVFCAVRGRRGATNLATDRTIASLSNELPHLAAVERAFEHDLVLAHTRFSIIDLSKGGHQPFVGGGGEITAVFNGEIYNYVELRRDLERAGVSFRTASDTEVLVEGFRVWREELWNKLNGFFAVALYDARDGSVTLARDRFGVAPLYYAETEQGFFFSSSIRSLLSETPDAGAIDRQRVLGFIQTSLKDFDDGTFFSAVKTFPRASHATFASGALTLDHAKPRAYWRLPARRWSVDDLSFDEAVKNYRETFFDAVDLRMRADVNVAFELSGGLDSSSVVAAAAELRDGGITTFTIRAPGPLNEEPYARAILERYPVDYQVLDAPESDFFDELPEFASLMEEPYHSPNIYTHFKMRQQMKARGFSVVLSGSGGDEVLAGYSAFEQRAQCELRDAGFRGAAMRHAIARRVFDQGMVRAAVGGLRHAARGVSQAMGFPASHTRAAGDPVATPALDQQRRFAELSFQEQVRFHFQVGLLPYYMASNDHFTMGVPVEHRFPFLDYRMVELGLQLPVPYLFRNGYSKYILRRAMEPYLPKKIVWRKRKLGFPFDHGRFLSSAQPRLAPYLKGLETLALPARELQDSGALLRSDPVRLWRTYCTGIWLSEVVGSKTAG